MGSHHQQVFDFRGFFDGGQHIALAPEWDPDPSEVVAHEATHATIVCISSLGYVQQIASFLASYGGGMRKPQATQAGKRISELIEAATVQVHEAVAWLVTEIVSARGSGSHAPDAYRADVDHLRRCLEAMPEKPFKRLEDYPPIFDPLAWGPIVISQAAAIFALSPPFVTRLIHSPGGDFLDRLRESLFSADEQPLTRFRSLLNRLRTTPFPTAEQWASWVLSWCAAINEPPPLKLSRGGFLERNRDVGHSGHVRFEANPDVIGRVLHDLSHGTLGSPDALTALWSAYYNTLCYDPLGL